MNIRKYNGLYIQLTTSVVCSSLIPAELLALQVYRPSSVLFILLIVRNDVPFPELFTFPCLIHCTSGSGVPDAEQLKFTEDPSL